jgi:phospholipase C
VDRREFLRAGVLLGGAAALGAACVPKQPPGPNPKPGPFGSILDGAPSESGIDTVVVVMMENRSLDSYFGYLANDLAYLERGRQLYGKGFRLDGDVDQAFTDPDGNVVPTYRRVESGDGTTDPWRGCGNRDPGHSWTAGRAQRDGGFLAAGTGNDEFALSWFDRRDLPLYGELASRFTLCDHAFASCLGPTYPNRAYLLSGQSGGRKNNELPFETGGYDWPTIFERLAAVGVTSANFATDLPPVALWGGRLNAHQRTIAEYYTAAAAGTLPNVSFVDPAFLGPNRTDDHPHGDPRAAQQFVQDVFRAFVRSSHWERGLFVLTYDEWGGFFDHVAPPILPDDRASADDLENFGQAGFRVPLLLCSPRALPNHVDHRQYDHTSLLRFLEWRFLGAPAEGPKAVSSTPWWLTARDRYANNLGRTLSPDVFDPDPGFDVDLDVGQPSPPCEVAAVTTTVAAPADDPEPSAFEASLRNGDFERIGARVPV